MQLETVALAMAAVPLARAAVPLARAAVPLTKAAVLFANAEQLDFGMGPAKHLSVFHQLPHDFQGTSLAMDKKR